MHVKAFYIHLNDFHNYNLVRRDSIQKGKSSWFLEYFKGRALTILYTRELLPICNNAEPVM